MMNKLIDSILYLLMWIFAFKLFDLVMKQYNIDDKKMIKISLVGLIITMYLYYSNTFRSSQFK